MNELSQIFKRLPIPTSFDEIWAILNNMSFSVALLVAGLLMMLAVYGYKMFRGMLYVISGVSLAFVGKSFVAPLVSDYIIPYIPKDISVDVDAAIAVACGLVGILLTRFAHKFIVFLLGVMAGYFDGIYFVAGMIANHYSNIPFIDHPIATKVIGVILGLMLAIILLLGYKHLCIWISSLGGMTVAFYLLGKILMPGEGSSVMFCFICFGIVFGVFALKHQFNEANKDLEFYF